MRYLVVFICIACFAPAGWAEEYKGYDVVTLLDSTAVEVDSNGSGSFAVFRSFKALTAEGGVANRVITYNYDPLTAFAAFKYATIYRAGGDVVNLDVTAACDYAAPARAIYWGARQIMLEVGWLEAGDRVEYEIVKKGFTYALLAGLEEEDSRFIPPMRGQFYDIVPFWVSEPTVRKVYRVSVPQEKELQFQFYQGDCASSMRYEDGRKVYTFASEHIRPFEQEPNMVDLFDAAPKLMLSSTPVWEAKSLWFNKVNEEYDSFAPLPEAQAKVDELIRGKRTEMEKIAALTHWVADNIRYAGISMGKGEGYTLHNTKMNFTDRCGVCKDIAGTLISFLRMAGMEAYPAMTMAGSRVETIPADHFNHCVTVVKLSNGTYMPLDPTWVPFCRELWSSAEQQQNYLPGIPEGSPLREIPLSAPENHYVRMYALNEIDEKGTLRGQFTITAEGQSDSNVRRLFTQGRQAEWQNVLEQQLLAVSPKARLIAVDYGKDPKNYQAAPIRITFRYEIPGYALAGREGEWVFKPFLMNNLYAGVQTHLRIRTDLPERKHGFKDACSRLVEMDETIRLPKGYALAGGHRQETKQSAAADFEGSLQQEADGIRLYQKLALKKRVYEASDWAGFCEAVNGHKSFGEYIVIKK
jgi:transglutaminase-like putative cysteine protease